MKDIPPELVKLVRLVERDTFGEDGLELLPVLLRAVQGFDHDLELVPFFLELLIADLLTDFLDPTARSHQVVLDDDEEVNVAGAVGLPTRDTHVRKEFESMQSDFESEITDVREELKEKFGDEGKVSRILDEHLGDDGKLTDHIENAFGDDGAFKKRLDKELGENGERIQSALDPDTEGTPTYRLKQTFKDEIDSIKEKIAQEEGAEEVRAETPLKGYDFEDQVETILNDLVAQTSNRVEDTSEKAGVKGDSKKGDFVVTLDDTDQQIVVEAKNGAFNGTVESEMAEAIENREADYGIFVASSIEYLPRTRLGWFSEIDQNFVVVALSDDDDDEVDPRFLKFAYHWARTRTILSYVEINNDIDSERVKAELDGIKEAIGRFSKIRTKCSDLESSVNSIRTELNGIEDDVTSSITKLESELGANEG